MIDLNTYRQRIGTFKQPGQKKTSFMNLRESRKENPEYFRNILRPLLLCLTVIISLSLHAENPWFHAVRTNNIIKNSRSRTPHQ